MHHRVTTVAQNSVCAWLAVCIGLFKTWWPVTSCVPSRLLLAMPAAVLHLPPPSHPHGGCLSTTCRQALVAPLLCNCVFLKPVFTHHPCRHQEAPHHPAPQPAGPDQPQCSGGDQAQVCGHIVQVRARSLPDLRREAQDLWSHQELSCLWCGSEVVNPGACCWGFQGQRPLSFAWEPGVS